MGRTFGKKFQSSSDLGKRHSFFGSNGEDDVLYGNDGKNTLNGKGGDDTLFGGDGNDRLIGGKGDDNVEGEQGNDLLKGNAGNDLLQGGSGQDTLMSGGGFDTLYGGIGNDRLILNADNLSAASLGDFTYEQAHDLMVGGPGNDRYIIRDGASVNVAISDIAGNDVLDLRIFSLEDCNFDAEGGYLYISVDAADFTLAVESYFAGNESDRGLLETILLADDVSLSFADVLEQVG